MSSIYKQNDYQNALSRLLDDKNFQCLIDQESRFNIFDAVGMHRQEINHSNFLAYLLDPQRPHGLGGKFLRDLIISGVSCSEPHEYFTPVEMRLMSFDDVTVYRELYGIDIVILSESKWVVLIENKVGAKEHGDQLIRYREMVHSKFGSLPALLFYLTPDASEPSDNIWRSLGYDLIERVLRHLQNNDSLPVRTRNLISDYCDLLEAEVLSNSRTAKLCRRIYRKHREAIDLLFEHSQKSKNLMIEFANQAMKNLECDEKIVIDDKYNRVFRFYDFCMKDVLPKIGGHRKWTSSEVGVLFEYEFYDQEMYLDLVVGPIDKSLRESILSDLKSVLNYNFVTNGQNFSHVSRDCILTIDEFFSLLDNMDERSIVEKIATRVSDVLDKRHKDLLEVICEKN